MDEILKFVGVALGSGGIVAAVQLLGKRWEWQSSDEKDQRLEWLHRVEALEITVSKLRSELDEKQREIALLQRENALCQAQYHVAMRDIAELKARIAELEKAGGNN